jgi:nitroreductase
MDVNKAITERRAYRSLEKVEIDEELVQDLAESARIAPSCFNNQPWRFVFAFGEEKLKEVFPVLTSGNKWATYSSMIIAVCSNRDLDCLVKGREYYLFDTGMATAFIILRATELGLVAHPIAGYDEEKIKKVLDIPDYMTVITLVIVGKKSNELNPVLSDDHRKRELERPERIPLEDFAFVNNYGG